jgi:hypothetical protein
VKMLTFISDRVGSKGIYCTLKEIDQFGEGYHYSLESIHG